MKRNSSRGKGGFTLVELVVVIAVLAILAGVGAVAYNGYIKKAKEAADLEKLDVIKTAAFAFMTENGLNCTKINIWQYNNCKDIQLYIDGSKEPYDIQLEVNNDGSKPTNEYKIPNSKKNDLSFLADDDDSFYTYLDGNDLKMQSEKFNIISTGDPRKFMCWTAETQKWTIKQSS